MIHQLPDDVKSYIRSGVAITSITQCVEELILNSIDAGATCVAVRVDVGCFKVQVVDNGHGIAVDELPLIGNRYATSKCHTVSDLDDLRYFGYRGEALASIKDACGILEIVTKTKSCPKPLCKLFQDGKALPIKESAIPRPSVGTTITAHALFMNFPVRQKSVNESLELEKIRQRVAGLALMKPHVSVRLRNDSTGATIIHTKKCTNFLVTFTSLFGQAKADALVEIKGEKDQFSVDGFVGKEGSTKKDVQFVYVNGRLVLNTKIHKLICHLIKKSAICKRKYGISSVSPTLPDSKDVFRGSPGKQLDKQPMFIVNVKCPLTEYDITFDPAKTLVEFKAWDKLLLCITNVINEFLKKEDLFTASTIQEYVNSDDAIGDNVQPVATISPSNIRDVLISKTAKRYKSMSKAILKTPEGMPLDKWKSENTFIHKADDTSTSSSDLLRGNSSLEQSSLFTDTEKSDTDTNGEPSYDGTSDSNLLLNNKAEVAGNANIIGNSCSSLRAVKESYFKKQAVVNTETSLNKPVICGRSALSSFRKLVGKSSITVPSALAMKTSIDESLKKISKILPSSSTTGISVEDKSEKALSSLQKFRKFASKFEHKVHNSDNQTKIKVLPAKFNKINVVPKVKNMSTFEDDLGNKPNFRTDSSVMDTNCSSSVIVERTGTNWHDSKSTKTDTKSLGSVNTTCHERKRTSSLINPITSKVMKMSHHCDANEKDPAAYGDQDERKSDYCSTCCKPHSCGTNDQHTCYGPNIVGKTWHQQALSNPPYVRHLADGELKFSTLKTKNDLTLESIRDNGCRNGLMNKQCGEDIAVDDKISFLSRRKTGMPCESLKTIQGGKRLDDGLDSVKGSKLLKEHQETAMPMPMNNSMTTFDDPRLIMENNQSNLRGSQLFKHLPYSEIDDVQKVNMNALYTLAEFPMDTKKAALDNAPADDVATLTEVPIGTHTLKLTLNRAISDTYDTSTGTSMKTNELIAENDFDDSVETFTAIPLHKAKFIEDIIVAGVDIQNNALCENSSQENIPDSLLDKRETGEETPIQIKDIQIDTVPETKVNIETNANMVFDSTQEFIPCTTPEDQIEGGSMTFQSIIDNECSTEESNSKEDDDNMSRSSTGFTPQLDNYTEPANINGTLSDSNTGNLEEASDEKSVPNMAKFPESSYMEQNELSDEMNTTDCNDVSQISQDTFDMPSILESSRLDKSDIEMTELVLSDYWHVKYDIVDTVSTKSQYEPHQHYSDWQEKDTDDVTVTQLLESTHGIKTESIEKCQTNVNILTFRDFFTPTPTQQAVTDLYKYDNVSSCQNGESMNNSTVNDLPPSHDTDEDFFTATCDSMNTNMADVTEPISMKDEDIVMASGIEADQKRDIKKEETSHQRSRDQSETECEVDETVDDDDNWIEMKHPNTGKKMFVHAKLGSVRDSLDKMSKEQNCQTDQSIIRTPKKALSTQMRTSVKPKHWETTAEPSTSSPPPPSDLQKMLCEHLERDDEDIDVKWRHRQKNTEEGKEGPKVADLFSEWENPVFKPISKSVMSVETGMITNKCSLKAMKTLHSCRFTKEMLQTVQVVGQLDNKFIVCLIQTDSSYKEPDMLAVVDQHAAHERVRLELLTEEAYLDGDVEKGELAKFNVNPGKPIKVDEEEIRVMTCYRDEFSRIGVTFRVDTHRDDVIKVISVPDCLVDKETPREQRKESIYWDTIQTLIKGHVELLMRTEGAKGRLPPIIHKLLCSQACHGAIKFSDALSLEECKSLIHDLSLCDLPFQCAHGRPAIIPVLQLQQLETRLPQKKDKPHLHKLKMAINKKSM